MSNDVITCQMFMEILDRAGLPYAEEGESHAIKNAVSATLKILGYVPIDETSVHHLETAMQYQDEDEENASIPSMVVADQNREPMFHRVPTSHLCSPR